MARTLTSSWSLLYCAQMLPVRPYQFRTRSAVVCHPSYSIEESKIPQNADRQHKVSMKPSVMILCLLLAATASATVFNFDAVGGKADDHSLATAQHNGGLLNSTLALMAPGDELFMPNKSYHMMGGVVANNLRDVTIHFEGTIVFDDTMKAWPRSSPGSKGRVLECLHFRNASNLTLTSNGKALFDGQGKAWWGLPGIGYLLRGENRPRLLVIEDSRNVLVENLFMLNSPYWTFWAPNADGLEVRHCDISARRTDTDGHDVVDMTAFNTDGYDVTGKNVWIHDCTVCKSAAARALTMFRL